MFAIRKSTQRAAGAGAMKGGGAVRNAARNLRGDNNIWERLYDTAGVEQALAEKRNTLSSGPASHFLINPFRTAIPFWGQTT